MLSLYSPQPLRVDDLRQTLKERIALALDLLREPIVGDEVDILQPVLARHRDVAPVRDEVDRVRLPKLLLRNGEVEGEVLGVAGVVLEEDETLVELGVERREIVQPALLSKPLREKTLGVSLLPSTVCDTSTYLGQKESCEGDVDEDALVQSLPQYPTDEAIPRQVVRCDQYVGKCRGDFSHWSYKMNLPSVAYECGAGYSSFFLFSNQSPRSASNTSLHRLVKNSLKTPPPSIPALNTEHPVSTHKKDIDRSSKKKNSLLLPPLVHKRNRDRRTQIDLSQPIEPVLRDVVPANRHPVRPAPAPLREPAGVHVVEHKLPEDAHAHVERNRERDVVQHAEARGEVRDLAFVQHGCAPALGLRELLLLKAVGCV